ncbi:nuclear apoptosis-inducing factor 1-like [Ixodes scapularis]
MLVPPYHPASNGAAERVVQTIKDKLKKSQPGDFRTQVARVLFQYRTTPHEVTGCAPCELLLGRMVKTPLDVLHPDLRSSALLKQLKQKLAADRGVFTEVHAKEEVPEENEFVPLCPIIDKVDELRYRLPPHQHCVAHTLNLIAMVDGARAEQTNQDYPKVAKGVFSKCHKLGNKQGQSAVAADAVKAHCGIYLPRPAITRWNSFFKSMEAIERQLKKEDDLDELFSKLAVPRLQRPSEPRFIEEFCLSRKANFSDNELSALVDGYEQRKVAIEGKGNSAHGSIAKQRAWKQITRDVFAVSGIRREVADIKKKWADVKSINKKRGAAVKKSQCATGGGVGDEPLNEMEERIVGLLNVESVEGIPGAFDNGVAPIQEVFVGVLFSLPPSGIKEDPTQKIIEGQQAITARLYRLVELHEQIVALKAYKLNV